MKKLRVHSLRGKKTQFGVKLLVELDHGFVFLPSRYTDLFAGPDPVGENFYIKTATVFMLILGFHRDKISAERQQADQDEEEEEFVTPILQFGRESINHDRKRKIGNTSLDVLASAAQAFEADCASKRPLNLHIPTPNLNHPPPVPPGVARQLEFDLPPHQYGSLGKPGSNM